MKYRFQLHLMLLCFTFAAQAVSPQTILISTADGGQIEADFYPAGATAVVLAHGAVFDKNSWQPLIEQLSKNKISSLAINFRGYGQSKAGSTTAAKFEDILAGVRYLRKNPNITKIVVLGASMGGGAAALATVKAEPGEISALILLSPAPINLAEKIMGNTLYIASRNEAGFSVIKSQFDRTQPEKQFKILTGRAHAQHIFKTSQKEVLIETIINFLNE
jgi:pimeloyl-ACP methyl ester carboxylesterase